LGVQPVAVPVRTTADIDPALESFARAPNGGLILPTDSFTGMRRQLIADLATRYRLPSVAANSEFPKDGGLMYYGASVNLEQISLGSNREDSQRFNNERVCRH
ncbi:MAG TPA: hypothetical protein VLL57_07620, partial [Candidatus Binataceae bacterium]|nr:hypothetical protein [Candidatus Binataceae bacterium]